MIEITEDDKSMPMSELSDMLIRDKNNMLRSIRLLARKYNKLGAEQKSRIEISDFERQIFQYQYGSVMKMLQAYATKYTDWNPSHVWDMPPNA